MKALRWHARGDVRVDDVAEPTPGPGQILVAVEYCGVCGTDLEEWRSGPIHVPIQPHPLSGRCAPVTLGHEVVGTVVESGGNGRGPAPGTLVIPDVVQGCGTCWWCVRHQEGLCHNQTVLGFHADGGLAQLIVADAATAVVVPDGLDPALAAFAEPTACAVRAIDKVPDIADATILVLGVGTIGLLVAAVARASGARRVLAADPNAARRELALSLGADVALDTGESLEARVADLTEGRGPDVVIECSGAPGVAARGVALTRRAGVTILVGIHDDTEPLNLLDAVLGEKRIVGSVAHQWDSDVTTAVRLLADGRVDPSEMIADRISLEVMAAEGFERMQSCIRPGSKLLVRPAS